MTNMYYTIAISLFTGLSLGFGLYGLAAFSFSVMVGTFLSMIVEKESK